MLSVDSEVGSRPARMILVVDDDRQIRELLGEVLAGSGFDVCLEANAEAALARLERHPVDLVVLDLSLPGMHGLDLLSELRRAGDVPVIILSARADASDRVLGLRTGADDYLAKPFVPRELVARVESVLRRATPAPRGRRIQYGNLVIDTEAREVLVGGRPVGMTSREFDLLVYLATFPRRVFSREQLLRQVWNSSVRWQQVATVTEHVRRLRLKIEPDPEFPRWIRTVRGIGYRFEP
ncbi:MAG: response regulator [Acidimicrobiia bacterium]